MDKLDYKWHSEQGGTRGKANRFQDRTIHGAQYQERSGPENYPAGIMKNRTKTTTGKTDTKYKYDRNIHGGSNKSQYPAHWKPKPPPRTAVGFGKPSQVASSGHNNRSYGYDRKTSTAKENSQRPGAIVAPINRRGVQKTSTNLQFHRQDNSANVSNFGGDKWIWGQSAISPRPRKRQITQSLDLPCRNSSKAHDLATFDREYNKVPGQGAAPTHRGFLMSSKGHYNEERKRMVDAHKKAVWFLDPDAHSRRLHRKNMEDLANLQKQAREIPRHSHATGRCEHLSSSGLMPHVPHGIYQWPGVQRWAGAGGGR